VWYMTVSDCCSCAPARTNVLATVCDSLCQLDDMQYTSFIYGYMCFAGFSIFFVLAGMWQPCDFVHYWRFVHTLVTLTTFLSPVCRNTVTSAAREV
jgi:hypothetical protein